MLVILPFIAYICFIDLSSVSFLCTVLKVEEDMDEGVLCEREDPEKMPFLGKDQTTCCVYYGKARLPNEE